MFKSTTVFGGWEILYWAMVSTVLDDRAHHEHSKIRNHGS